MHGEADVGGRHRTGDELPCPPMLNTPVAKPSATPVPARISGVAGDEGLRDRREYRVPARPGGDGVADGRRADIEPVKSAP